MNKSLIYASICLCIGSSVIANVALAKGKPNSNCPDADVVLSKQYPNYDLNHLCADTYPGTYSNSGECDPDNPNPADYVIDADNGLVIAGTNGNNIIHGTSGPDTICGGNGNDEIYGEEGDDTIYGDNGKDSLYGGLGDDEIHGGNGKDHVSGYDDDHNDYALTDSESDDDTLYGDNGKDDLSGGPGVDDIYGGRGKDSCSDPEVTECDATNLEDGPKHH